MLQALGAKLISKDLAMRELPFGVNVSQEIEKIEIEEMRNALVGSLQAYASAIPQIATQGGDPSDIIRKVSDVIKARQKGVAIEEAVAEVFTPEPQVPPAGAASPAEPPVPSAPGAPAGGPIPIEQGRPELQTLLSSLTASGQGNARVSTINRR